ncbi:hypothetical protein [Mycobacterium intracellulare]|uniref:Uncharacterized protein n=1 Tax=Mycobacterium intracellulare subsp. chimaera TaxID=222805 RepID=A0ABT7P3D7_MYCIT|nr:hypothetical protein [Mycobacterium intracellulare]MDM3927775.1 hypothetical protein [Mycobacterium intracellulare subsp. chimaera]
MSVAKSIEVGSPGALSNSRRASAGPSVNSKMVMDFVRSGGIPGIDIPL